VVQNVLSWTNAEERDDDMTLIIAKILEPGKTVGEAKAEGNVFEAKSINL
jgi:hypothetical protein